jgi:uncharacterized protein YhhL (DUF1145 family)
MDCGSKNKNKKLNFFPVYQIFNGELEFEKFWRSWLVNVVNPNFPQNFEELMIDSGGLQFQRGMGIESKFEIFQKQKLGKYCFILDQPHYGGEWKKGIEETKQNIQLQIDSGLKNNLILILHGTTFQQMSEWWEELKIFDFGKIAIANKLPDRLTVSYTSLYLKGMLFLFLNEDRSWDVFHLLGVNSPSSFYSFFYILREFEDRFKMLSWDSSNHVKFATTLTFKSPIFKELKLREIENCNKLPCDCKICEMFNNNYTLSNILKTNPKQIYNYLIFHHIFLMFSCISNIWRLSEDKSFFEKFVFNYYKNNPQILKLLSIFKNYKEGRVMKKELFDRIEGKGVGLLL